MVLKTTFNNISVISWRSVSLSEETVQVHRENHRPAARPTEKEKGPVLLLQIGQIFVL
jgi:hypothetical protein